MEAVLPHRTADKNETFLDVITDGGGVPPAFSGERSRRPLNFLQRIGQTLTTENYRTPMSIEWRWKRQCAPTSAFNPLPTKSVLSISVKTVTLKLKFKFCCFLVKYQTLQWSDSFISCCCLLCSLCYSYTRLLSASWIIRGFVLTALFTWNVLLPESCKFTP